MALNKRKVLDAARKHAQKGAKAKALKEYNKLLKEDPRDAKLLLEVGDAYRRWGQNEEAIAQYGKVAQQYRQDGFDARAVAVFKQILNLDPKNYGAYVSLSELYQRMGLDSEAVAALQTAADGYHKEGRKSEALDLLRQMAALDPTNTTSRLKVAELLRQEGMEAEAVAEYEAVVAELENQDDREQLVTVLERLLEVKPDKIDAITALVRQFMLSGDLDRAEPLAIRALNVDAGAPQFELLMDLYAQMGDDAKLADATRGLAKIYRERGDEERARELMQRLPVEEVGSSSRLAVDVSEVEEPDLGEDELLDDEEPFLSLDEESGDLGGEPSLELGEEPLLDLGSDAEMAEEPLLEAETEADPEPEPEAPLPEGDPDQLLAEASVYLRYGKRDQAIASLRGILAQDPDHRAALEKLGEAYADDGQHSEAVQVWMKAAEQIRRAGDADALAVLKDRVASLDPGMAEQIDDIAPGTPTATEAPPILELETEQELDAPAIDLDLDVEVDLDLDTAIDDVEHSETQTGYDFGAEDDDFEIQLDEDSVTFDTPPVEAAVAPDSPVVEVTQPDVPAAHEEAAADDDFEIELDGDGLGFAGEDDEEDASVEFDLDAEALTSPPTGTAAGQTTATAAQISEELEEAEFYIAQEMHGEARSILERILEKAPNHPAALLRLGEIAEANGEAPDDATDSGVGTGQRAVPELETTARFGEDDDFEVEVDFDDDDVTAATEPDGETTEPGLDLASADLEITGDAPVEEAEGLELDMDVEVDLDLDEAEAEAGVTADDAAIPIEDELTDEHGVSAEAADTEAALAEEGPVEDITPEAAEPAEEAPTPPDAGESFDLREALADVLADDEPAAADPNEESGVLSTVEDGFESIFSDFKRGVSATLDEGDFDTRYDLGIAYREMGLFEDAIGEFRVCLDSAQRRFDSLYLMGLCARDLGRFEDAVSHLEQALALPDLPEDRMAGVYFDLSIAEEGAGDPDRACTSLQRVLEIEPDFPGAAERLATLEAGQLTSPKLGEPGEAFESFDELFEEDADDEAGDAHVAAAAGSEAFESFDDIVSEAEAALDDADFVPEAAPSEGEAPAGEDAPNNDDTQTVPRKGGRKKISFV